MNMQKYLSRKSINSYDKYNYGKSFQFSQDTFEKTCFKILSFDSRFFGFVGRYPVLYVKFIAIRKNMNALNPTVLALNTYKSQYVHCLLSYIVSPVPVKWSAK